MSEKPTREVRSRYASIIQNRFKAKIDTRTQEVRIKAENKDKFLKDRGVFEDYQELQRLKDKQKELETFIQGVLGTCSSIDYAIDQKMKEQLMTDSQILKLKRELRKYGERIMLAKDFGELDSIIEETNDDKDNE